MGTTGQAPNVGKTYAKEMAAYTQYLPQILAAQNAAVGPAAGAQLAATQATQPGYNQLNLDQLQRYALPNAAVNQQVTNSNALAGAQTNLNQLQGAGGQAATSAVGLNNALNPVQATDNTQAQNLVNSINLNGLSGGEQSAVERSLNQSNYAKGQLGIDNATTAVSNAMNFGDRLAAKRAELGNALGTATGVASAQNQQVNPVNIALGQPNQSNNTFGTSTNAGTQAGTFGTVSGSGNQFFGGLNNTASANQNNQLIGSQNAASAGHGGILSDIGGNANSCCFIFLEAYNGVLPESVRICRDYFYRENEALSNGYKRMAKWLVPLMRRSKLVRHIVNAMMVKPLTKNGEWLCYRRGRGYLLTPVREFWFTVWKLTS